jgi:hypothetical protein
MQIHALLLPIRNFNIFPNERLKPRALGRENGLVADMRME